MPIPKRLDHAFFSSWSPSMAYVLGYFAADGSMINARQGAYSIEFTSTDEILLRRVRRAVGSGHHISVRPNRNACWKTQYRLQIGSKSWFSDLRRLGFTGKKSKTMLFPDVPSHLLGDFVRGYFDGDGCVYFAKLKYRDRLRKRFVLLTLFTSGSRSFLESLHEALLQQGIRKGTIVSKRRGFELKFSHADSLALHQLMYNTAQVADLFLPRKREKLEEAIRVLGLDKSVRS